MTNDKPNSGSTSDKSRRDRIFEDETVLPGDKDRAEYERKHRKDDDDALVTGSGGATIQGSQPGARPGGSNKQDQASSSPENSKLIDKLNDGTKTDGRTVDG
jgi:hypothetical protein